ncbi:MAG: TIGR00296 family protein [Nitrososphaerota archaeon]|jgi:uncharacterized protein (TIGR00296 family)|nr:TIGR00296 family protein [Nitrososphaerota archaeon]
MAATAAEEWNDEDGTFFIMKARAAIEEFGRNKLRPSVADVPPKYLVKRGVFVTLRNSSSKELLGCIGRPYPSASLMDNLIDSAIDAAFSDPRFPPLDVRKLDRTAVEVSILTLPKEIKVKTPLDYRGQVKVGRDGIIVEWAGGGGLLLPQVPVEEKWGIDEYLSYGCMKAGAQPDLWLSGKIKLFTFQASVFEEKAPNGPVVRFGLES